MWLKLCLLLIYITVLFILARILEAISWYETGALSKRLLDPMTLSVMKLKALLEQRGVSFEGVVLEKSDLTELVEGSGPVTEDDMDSASHEEEATAVTNFTSGAHFFEQVEDAKDSVWLIQIYSHRGPAALLADSRWKAIRKKVSRFGVRAGILDCSLDFRYCENRGWDTPRLLLALPGEFEAKSNVHIHTYSGPCKTSLLYNWIREKLDGKVEKITDKRQFAGNWDKFKDPLLNPEIRTVLFTNRQNIPMFFSALSVKFPGRVKFGMVDTDSSGGKEIMKYMTMRNRTKVPIPSYMVITAEKASIYGDKTGENLSFSAMENYFKTLYPCLNDIFIITIIITNVLSIFELCLVQGTIFKRLKKFLWYFVKSNVILIMLWLPIVGLFQLPYLDKIPLWLLKTLRIFSTTNMATHLRKDFSFYTFHSSILTSVFIAYAIFVGFLEYKRKGGEEENEQGDENYWNFTEMRTLEHLMSPVDPLRTLIQPSNIFGERRMFNYYRPVLSLKYIQDLPRWRCALPVYNNGDNDISSASCDCSKTVADSSENKPLNDDYALKNCGTCDSHPAFLDSQTHEDTSKDYVPPCDPSIPDLQMSSSLDQRSEVKESFYSCSPPSTGKPDKTCQCLCHKSNNKPDVPLIDPSSPDGFLQSTQCVICLDDYRFGVMLCGLPCSHTFHESCVVTWLNRGSHYCPVCRWPAFKLKPCDDMTMLSE